MSAIGPLYSPGVLNPTAPEFLPANHHPFPIFIPTRIFHLLPPPPPPPPFFPHFAVNPPHLPPISVTPTRAVLLIPIPPEINESSVKREMEVFGEVRGVQIERANEGIVTVHFYDLRGAQRAVKEIHKRHMHHEQLHFRGGSALVWAHFVFPHLKALPDGNNQGSLVIMNLEPTVSSKTLRHIFQAFGEVKELRDTPYKKEQRFIEFFDVRDAAKALNEMNGNTIAGKQIIIQFSRPGGLGKKFFNKNFSSHPHIYQPLPPPPHHRPRLLSPPLHFRRRGAINANNRPYEQQQKYTKRPNKHTKKNLTARCYVINEDAITADESSGCRDQRTTVMIRNIPNKYSQKLLLKMLDSHCNECNEKIINEGNSTTPMSSYDFVYLPIDFVNKCNVGYGFVNMTTPKAVWRLHKAFHNQHWGLFQSRKICEVTYARIQGVESLKEHFKNSKLPGVDIEKYLPVIFSPPRDGKLLSEPIRIVDLGTKLVDDDSCQCGDGTVSEGCDGDRCENGGVSDDES